jgi:DMSO/TMAO reductase YedYZ heme-binding membrane subunit
MFLAVLPPIIRSSETVHTASGIVKLFYWLPLAWVSWNAVAACIICSHISELSTTTYINQLFLMIVTLANINKMLPEDGC